MRGSRGRAVPYAMLCGATPGDLARLNRFPSVFHHGLGESPGADLDRPHDPVAHDAGRETAELFRHLATNLLAQDDGIHDDKRNATPHHQEHACARSGVQVRVDQGNDEGNQHEDESHGHEILANVVARVHEVANKASLFTPVTVGHVFLIAGHHCVVLARGDLATLLAISAASLLAISCHERASPRRLGFLAATGRSTFARGLDGGLRGFRFVGSHPGILRGREFRVSVGV